MSLIAPKSFAEYGSISHKMETKVKIIGKWKPKEILMQRNKQGRPSDTFMAFWLPPFRNDHVTNESG